MNCHLIRRRRGGLSSRFFYSTTQFLRVATVIRFEHLHSVAGHVGFENFTSHLSVATVENSPHHGWCRLPRRPMYCLLTYLIVGTQNHHPSVCYWRKSLRSSICRGVQTCFSDTKVPTGHGARRNECKHHVICRTHPRRSLRDPECQPSQRWPNQHDANDRAFQEAVRSQRSEERRKLLSSKQSPPCARAHRARSQGSRNHRSARGRTQRGLEP